MSAVQSRLLRVAPKHVGVVRELLEQYRSASGEYVITQPTGPDFTNEQVIMDHVVQGGSAYLISVDQRICGLVLATHQQTEGVTTSSLVNILVLRRFRKRGIGTWAMRQLFRLHRGKWSLLVKADQTDFLRFTRRVIEMYAGKKHDYQELPSFADNGMLFTFDNRIDDDRESENTLPAWSFPYAPQTSQPREPIRPTAG